MDLWLINHCKSKQISSIKDIPLQIYFLENSRIILQRLLENCRVPWSIILFEIVHFLFWNVLFFRWCEVSLDNTGVQSYKNTILKIIFFDFQLSLLLYWETLSIVFSNFLFIFVKCKAYEVVYAIQLTSTYNEIMLSYKNVR